MIFKSIYNISVYIEKYIYTSLYDFSKRCCTCSWSGVHVIIMVGWWTCVGNHLGYFRIFMEFVGSKNYPTLFVFCFFHIQIFLLKKKRVAW